MSPCLVKLSQNAATKASCARTPSLAQTNMLNGRRWPAKLN
jgi:hypothetical protein